MNNNFKIINGNSLIVLDSIKPNSIDAIITDPPYELGFMGKKWDSTGIAYNVQLWEKALRVLKPGGYLLAFGGTRTYHRIACAIEDAGFEIRDCIMWLYGSGFPKSHNIGLAIDKKNGIESEVVGSGKSGTSSRAYQSEEKTTAGGYDIKKATNEWNGWGTALKPAYEPVIMARKPVEGSATDNILKYGTGGINIDECRVGNDKISTHNAPKGTFAGGEPNRGSDTSSYKEHEGRWPSNVIHDGSDEVTKDMPKNVATNPKELGDYGFCFDEGKRSNKQMSHGYEDSSSVSRYFYCAKASGKDRDEGLDLIINSDNIHPTVKPVELMQYLVRLVAPKNATILDIFNGSGSTGKAVAFENRERNANYKYIGIELDPQYCKISEARIEYALNKYKYDVLEEIKENEKKGQLSLFDDFD